MPDYSGYLHMDEEHTRVERVERKAYAEQVADAIESAIDLSTDLKADMRLGGVFLAAAHSAIGVKHGALNQGVTGFLDAIIKGTPNGEWISIQYHPNGDWSVAQRPMSRPTPDLGEDELVALNGCIDAIAAAEGALARAAKLYPELGSCPIRAIIDVERGNLKSSRQHVLAGLAALSQVR